MSKQIEIYTDGGASPNPGKGAWAAVILENGKKVRDLSGGEKDTSNKRMELLAAIKALEALEKGCEVTLYTDSNYMRGGITSWIHNWKKNGWKTAAKKPVKNQDLWQKLDEATEGRTIEWKWVKGHDGDEWNEYVDLLVNQTRDKL